MSKIEEEKKKFNEWWSYVTSNSNSWTTLQRIAAHDSWMAARGLSGYIKPPEPKLEVGKSYRSAGGWIVINRKGDEGNYGFNPDGEFQYGLCCSIADEWQEIPESEAIALLEKECVKRYGDGWRDVKIKESIYYDTNTPINSGRFVDYILSHAIWNRNGCIFYNGKWAEKLEEPKIKEGQMVWVKADISKHWAFRPFSRIYRGNVFSKTKIGRPDTVWDQCSLTNPYHDSIEARAIELLRDLMAVQNGCPEYICPDEYSAVTGDAKEFLKEIDRYEMD